jgi:hypothetical protein
VQLVQSTITTGPPPLPPEPELAADEDADADVEDADALLAAPPAPVALPVVDDVVTPPDPGPVASVPPAPPLPFAVVSSSSSPVADGSTCVAHDEAARAQSAAHAWSQCRMTAGSSAEPFGSRHAAPEPVVKA